MKASILGGAPYCVNAATRQQCAWNYRLCLGDGASQHAFHGEYLEPVKRVQDMACG